ncbi:hypothetical protein EV715DRAFT_268174 [Schizophyllum commune]
MATIHDRTCPACKKVTKTVQGKNIPLSKSEKCAQYRLSKLHAMSRCVVAEVLLDSHQPGSGDMGAAAQQAATEVEEDLFYFAPPRVPENGEPGPGPSTQAYRVARDAARHPIDTNGLASLVEDEYVLRSAGKVVRMDERFHELWRKMFGDTASDPIARESDAYLPFASELDYRIASWAVNENISQLSFDHLLAIPGVKERLGLSFHNTYGLYKTLNKIKPPAGDWSASELRFPDAPEEVHVVYKRNPIDAIRSLWEDPSLSEHLVYRPKRIFTNRSREDRIYSEMWTGRWWPAIQSQLPEGATLWSHPNYRPSYAHSAPQAFTRRICFFPA